MLTPSEFRLADMTTSAAELAALKSFSDLTRSKAWLVIISAAKSRMVTSVGIPVPEAEDKGLSNAAIKALIWLVSDAGPCADAPNPSRHRQTSSYYWLKKLSRYP